MHNVIMLDGVRMTPSAARCAEAAGVYVAEDLYSLRAETVTPEDLLDFCLEGADDEDHQAWRDYVAALEAAAWGSLVVAVHTDITTARSEGESMLTVAALQTLLDAADAGAVESVRYGAARTAAAVYTRAALEQYDARVALDHEIHDLAARRPEMRVHCRAALAGDHRSRELCANALGIKAAG